MSNSTSLHHITAIAGDPQQNLDFYTQILGLQLVKKTVNFDDPSTYQLFYGDEVGNPGSILSFFCNNQFSKGEPDTGQAIAVSLAVPTASIDFWAEHLSGEGINSVEPFERFGKLVIGFQDPDGLHLELIGDPHLVPNAIETGGPIPPEHAIGGLHGFTLAEENYRATGQLLQESLGFEEVTEEHDRILYQAGAKAVEIIDGAALDGASGRGTVHHIAFGVKNEKQQQSLKQELEQIGYHLTDIEDRHYFRSFFFHEPGGAMIEVATDGPRFTVDENKDQLGSDLCLPPRLESKRELIEAELPEIER